MFAAWMIMLALGNAGHAFSNKHLFFSYWACLPLGLLIDIYIVRVSRSSNG